MYKLGDGRKFSRLVPGLMRVSVLRAEADYAPLKGEGKFVYSVVRYRGHDPFFSRPARKTLDPEGEYIVDFTGATAAKAAAAAAAAAAAEAAAAGGKGDKAAEASAAAAAAAAAAAEAVGGANQFDTTLHVPHYGYDSIVSIELYESVDGELEHVVAAAGGAGGGGKKKAGAAAAAAAAAAAEQKSKKRGMFGGEDDDAHDDDDDDEDGQEAKGSGLHSSSGDLLLGVIKVPVTWILNGFGMGYGTGARESCSFSMRTVGGTSRRQPFEVFVRMAFESLADDEAAAQKSHLRWTAHVFEGDFRLDRNKSSSMEALYQSTGVPFPLRKLEEQGGDEKLELRIGSGGNSARLRTLNSVYHADTGWMKVDGIFQSAPTFFGTMVERRLYWDFSNMGRVVAHQPYPSPILMMVTSMGPQVGEVVEAWEMADGGRVLNRLGMLQDKNVNFKRTYVRMDNSELEEKLLRAPPTVTKEGILRCGILAAKNLQPEEGEYVDAYVTAKLHLFDNQDTTYHTPLENDDQEKNTRSFYDEANPRWNQVFSFSVRRTGTVRHYVLMLYIWNKDPDEGDELIGSCRVPLPWIYNSFASGLGPQRIGSLQGWLKLKRGDARDPTQKFRYGGGRVLLKFSYETLG